jgi:hypothetical protein
MTPAFKVSLEILVDYEPKFLDSIKADLSHKFDVPLENITISCSPTTDYKEMFAFLGECFKDLFGE